MKILHISLTEYSGIQDLRDAVTEQAKKEGKQVVLCDNKRQATDFIKSGVSKRIFWSKKTTHEGIDYFTLMETIFD